jgi:hypothetical protein
MSAVGCGQDVDGPGPDIGSDDGDKTFPFDPMVACRVQLETPIVVTGTNFSPITIGIPDDPHLVIPRISTAARLTVLRNTNVSTLNVAVGYRVFL